LAALGTFACTSHSVVEMPPDLEEETTVAMSEWPTMAMDLIFMIDNSSSMAPKQEKLKEQLPKLIAGLYDPTDRTLPDLRVAIITSDLGTGNAITSGPCGPKVLADGTVSAYGDGGRFQMAGASACGVQPGAEWLEYRWKQPVNYAGEMEDVFACLVGNIGFSGCEQEHPLQAFEFALGLAKEGSAGQTAMLRPNAYLGLVFVTDEDDCSAATNDSIFAENPSLIRESPSLRCATRAHVCNGHNLDIFPPGFPASGPFTAPLENCAARTDACPNATDETGVFDTSVPTYCNPLKSVTHLIDEIRSLKKNPDEQIIAVGIFGWPTYSQKAKARYKIDRVPNPDTGEGAAATVYDLWPVCYDPDHLPVDENVYDPVAAGWGATPGLRLSAFIDAFGENGQKISICERDFPSQMNMFYVHGGRALCMEEKLVDVDSTRTGLQADCWVVYRRPTPDPTDPDKIIFVEDTTSMPACEAERSDDDQPAYPCWRVIKNMEQCWGLGQNLAVVRAPAERHIPLEPGTKTMFTCRTCITDVPDLPPNPRCDY
jgi:hypothetical protein